MEEDKINSEMIQNEDKNDESQDSLVKSSKGRRNVGCGIIIIIVTALLIGLFYIFVILPLTYQKKPVIYLYPTEKTDVSVSLNLNGKLICTYPDYNNGWNVTAYPDGKIINKADGKEYSYLYWEGESNTKYDFSKGFVVKGEDTSKFLQEKLSFMGLTPKEYNEFIVYWLPQMQNNKYNLITFQNKAYTENAVLNINPKPDSMLRVFMAYKPLKKFVEVDEQKLDTFERKGFTVVEWGGACITKTRAK